MSAETPPSIPMPRIPALIDKFNAQHLPDQWGTVAIASGAAIPIFAFGLNIHHVELFYYVARHGGISRAVRHIPYGIQQPAVSSQMLALESDVGAKLFERTPFRLTAAGQKLYAFVRPFFSNIETVAATLRTAENPCLRVGAVEMVIRDHLHSVIDRLRASYPRLQLSFKPGYTPQLMTWLEEGQIEVAIAPLLGRPSPPLRSLRLMRVPLVLQVPKRSEFTSAEQVWARRPVDATLIGLPPTETISRVFRQELLRRRIKWSAAIEASSLLAVTRYVAHGHGVGINVDTEVSRHPKVRVLPLPDFAPLDVAIVWSGKPTPLINGLLEESQRYVSRKWPSFCDNGASK